MIGAQQAQLWVCMAILWTATSLYIPRLARPFPKRAEPIEEPSRDPTPE